MPEPFNIQNNLVSHATDLYNQHVIDERYILGNLIRLLIIDRYMCYPFFSKIFEKIIYNYVVNFMEKHDTIYKYQFGFRKQHSTQHAIITLVDKIASSLDSGDII